jgi:hypothetical protein
VELHEVLKLLQREPPPVHVESSAAWKGVLAASPDCLKFLADRARPGARTLETGCGSTTAVLTAARCQHTSIFYEAKEGTRFLAWCEKFGVATDQLELLVGSSPFVLAAQDPTPLDLVVIDGGHAYPFPQVDWYFTARRLVVGGTLVVDDVQLPAPYDLLRFLDRDPRWLRLAGTHRWAAFERVSEDGVDEDWYKQDFYRMPPRGRARQVVLSPKPGRKKRELERALRRKVRNGAAHMRIRKERLLGRSRSSGPPS